MSDDIIDITDRRRREEQGPEIGDTPAEVIRGTQFRACRHRAVLIDVEKRSVECRTCGAVVDPVDALVMLAGEWARIRAAQAHMRARDKKAAEAAQKKSSERAAKRQERLARRARVLFEGAWHATAHEGGRTATAWCGVSMPRKGRKWATEDQAVTCLLCAKELEVYRNRTVLR